MSAATRPPPTSLTNTQHDRAPTASRSKRCSPRPPPRWSPASPRAASCRRARCARAIDRGPLLPDEALQAKLVDHIGYRDEAIAAARKRAGAQAKLVGLSTYLGGAERPNRAGARIALIYGSGLIVSGSGSDGPLSGSAGDGRRRCGPRLSRRGARPQGARDPVPHRQPRRLGRSPRRRSGARSSWPARRASRSSSRWAMSPARAAITSPHRPPRSSPSRRP